MTVIRHSATSHPDGLSSRKYAKATPNVPEQFSLTYCHTSTGEIRATVPAPEGTTKPRASDTHDVLPKWLKMS